MIKDAQLKNTLDTLFGCGVNSLRAMTLSKMRDGSGKAPGESVFGGTERA